MILIFKKGLAEIQIQNNAYKWDKITLLLKDVQINIA